MANELFPTSEPPKGLSEKAYWDIIELSLQKAYDQDSQEALLVVQLQQLPANQIIDFEIFTRKLMAESYRSDLWCAADIINNGCSDDGFDYFRAWLISRGKEVFEAAMKDPDGTLARVVDPSIPFYDFEIFLYAARTAYRQQTGQAIHGIVMGKFPANPMISLDWNQNRPASYLQICPRLFALYDGYRKQQKQPRQKKINTADFRKRYRRR